MPKSQILNVVNISFNAIPENKIIAEISKFAVCCVLEQDTLTSAKYWFNPGIQGIVPT